VGFTGNAGNHDDPDLQEVVQHDAAYREIVLRYGEKVTLDQVLETLRDLGWQPPVRRKPLPISKAAKAIPLKMGEERLETCPSCKEDVNPVAAPILCRHAVRQCPYKSAKF
jgi:hypothetical protein